MYQVFQLMKIQANADGVHIIWKQLVEEVAQGRSGPQVGGDVLHVQGVVGLLGRVWVALHQELQPLLDEVLIFVVEEIAHVA
jgi:hypothetical protein